MNAEQARAEFDKMIANATDADQIAKLELAREYFCNPKFKKALEDFTAQANGL